RGSQSQTPAAPVAHAPVVFSRAGTARLASAAPLLSHIRPEIGSICTRPCRAAPSRRPHPANCSCGGLCRSRVCRSRTAHATHLLSSGVHPKVASERLGHSKVGITLDLYSHVLPGMQEDAAARVDDALQRALQSRTKE